MPSPPRAPTAPSPARAERCAAPAAQVYGCGEELSRDGLGKRYRVCAMHLAAPAVELEPGGQPQRYCRTCSRFQDLSEFAGDRRTCMRQLAAHAARRLERLSTQPPRASRRAARGSGNSSDSDGRPTPTRVGVARVAASSARVAKPVHHATRATTAAAASAAEAAAEAAAEPNPDLRQLFDHWASDDPVDREGEVIASLLGTIAAPPAAAARDTAADVTSAHSWAANGEAMVPPGAPLTAWPLPVSFGPAMHPGALASFAPTLASHELTLKFQNAVPSDYSLNLAPSIGAFLPPGVLHFEGHIQPGCSLLTVHALREVLPPPLDAEGNPLPPCAEDAPGELSHALPDAEALARHLAASEVGPWLRTQARVTLRVGAGDGTPGAAVLLRYGMVDDTARADPAPDAPRLPRLAPAAVAITARRAAVLRFETPAPRGVPLLCMLNGRTLRHVIGSDGTLRLPSMPEEGVVFVARALADAAAPPRPVLLTQDAAIAAEVAAAMPGGAKNAQDDAALATLGVALRLGAQPDLLRAAAAETLRRGWGAASARLLRALREALDSRPDAQAEAEDEEEPERRQALLTAAVLGLSPGRVVPVVLREGGAACIFGSPILPTPGGGDATPLHLAAMLTDGAAVTALCDHSRSATVAWFTLRALCADGAHRTPAAMACLAAAVSDAPRRAHTPAAAHAALVARLHREARASRAAEHTKLYSAYVRDSAAASRAHALMLVPMMMSWEVLAFMTRLYPMSDERIAAIVAQPVWKDAIYAFTAQASALTAVLRIIGIVAMTAAALLPQLREFYVRNHCALLMGFAGTAMVFSPAVTEWQFRARHGLLLWPFAGQVFETVCALTLAAGVPLRLSCHLMLLTTRLSLYLVANLLPLELAPAIWPRTGVVRQGVALNVTVNLLCMLILTEMDKNAFARWTAARRRKALKSD